MRGPTTFLPAWRVKPTPERATVVPRSWFECLTTSGRIKQPTTSGTPKPLTLSLSNHDSQSYSVTQKHEH